MAPAKKMTYILCGGGSGGHITPLVAVARALKKQEPMCKVIYIGEKNGKFSRVAKDSGVFDELHYVAAGKLRRYHGEPLLRKLTDLKTIYFNIRDVFRMLVGTVQGIRLLRNLKADAVLLKGGYVCVPISFAAKINKVPSVTHDSDAHPGLSNRIAARYATYHATAMPAIHYKYPKDSIRHVGLPVNEELFRKYSSSEQRFLREKYNIDADAQVLLITGGSNGAQRLNAWCVQALPELLDAYPKLAVIHIVGPGNERQYNDVNPMYRNRITVIDFTTEMHHLSAISDIIITRAGASTLTEFAAQSKACIVVPNPDLTGGHQLKNAKAYHTTRSILVVNEKEMQRSVVPLQHAAKLLLDDDQLRSKLGKALHQTLPKEPADESVADLLREVARSGGI